MTAFAFSTVASILSEPGVSQRLGALVAERFPGTRRPFIVTDAGFLRTGLLDLPRLSLEQEGMVPALYSEVTSAALSCMSMPMCRTIAWFIRCPILTVSWSDAAIWVTAL